MTLFILQGGVIGYSEQAEAVNSMFLRFLRIRSFRCPLILVLVESHNLPRRSVLTAPGDQSPGSMEQAVKCNYPLFRPNTIFRLSFIKILYM